MRHVSFYVFIGIMISGLEKFATRNSRWETVHRY